MEWILRLQTYYLYEKAQSDSSGYKLDLLLFEIDINWEHFKVFVRTIFEDSFEKMFEIVKRSKRTIKSAPLLSEWALLILFRCVFMTYLR